MRRTGPVCLWVKAELPSLSAVSRFVQGWLCSQAGYRENRRERYLVELAVVEACTNVVRYAYPGDSAGKLGVCLRRQGTVIEVLILDRGVPFDPTRFVPPEPCGAREGGYGIYLIRRVMRSMKYERRGSLWNCLYLVRDVPGPAAAVEPDQRLRGLRQRIVTGEEQV